MELYYLYFLAAGLLGGLLLGLIGVGMALVTVPLLIFALPSLGFSLEATPQIALATSMVVVSLGSLSAVVAQQKKQQIDWFFVKLLLPFSVIGLGVGTWLVYFLPAKFLTLIFAVFLAFVAWTLLKPKVTKFKLVGQSTLQHRAIATVIGSIGGLIGAGGGVLMVPWLSATGLVLPKAVATSVMLGFPLTVLASFWYLLSESPSDSTALIGSVYWPGAFLLSVGAALTAPLGVKLATRLPVDELKKLFAIVLLLVAFQLLYKNSATIGL